MKLDFHDFVNSNYIFFIILFSFFLIFINLLIIWNYLTNSCVQIPDRFFIELVAFYFDIMHAFLVLWLIVPHLKLRAFNRTFHRAFEFAKFYLL